MKTTNYFFLLSCCMCISMVNAQNSALTVFASGGEKFFLIMNGERYNNEAQTNVRITDLAPKRYDAKVIFENTAWGEVDKNFYLNPAKEQTFEIKKKKESKLSKGLKSEINAVNANWRGKEANDIVNNKNDWYVVRMTSEIAYGSNVQTPQPVQRVATPANAYPAANRQTTTTTTTSTTQTGSNPAGESVSISINAGGTSVGGNVSVSGSATGTQTETYYEETTTTTTVNGGATVPSHYEMAGYNGPYGCPWPMQLADFTSAKSTVSSKTFDDSRLSIAKQVVRSNCLFADQVFEITRLMEFEESKLEFAKFAFPFTYDQGNYFKVHNAFEFEMSIEELNEAIGH